jgi:hypothetical protein
MYQNVKCFNPHSFICLNELFFFNFVLTTNRVIAFAQAGEESPDSLEQRTT